MSSPLKHPIRKPGAAWWDESNGSKAPIDFACESLLPPAHVSCNTKSPVTVNIQSNGGGLNAGNDFAERMAYAVAESLRYMRKDAPKVVDTEPARSLYEELAGVISKGDALKVMYGGRQLGKSTMAAQMQEFQTKLKENEMQIQTLINLANAGEKDEFTRYDALPNNLKDALKRKFEEQEKNRVEAAADTVLELLNRTEININDRVARIRELRREVDRLKGDIGKLETAREYGMETQNFIPLASVNGVSIPMEQQELLMVPSTFKPKAKPVKK